MPQFDPSTFASQVFWLAIAFFFMYVLVGRFAFPKIERVIEGRAERIARDLADAEQLRADADATMKRYDAALKEAHDKAVAAINEAAQSAAQAAAARSAEADRAIAARVDQAVAAIDKSRAEAVTHLKEIATDLALDITAKLAGTRPDALTVAAQVDAALARKKAA